MIYKRGRKKKKKQFRYIQRSPLPEFGIHPALSWDNYASKVQTATMHDNTGDVFFFGHLGDFYDFFPHFATLTFKKRMTLCSTQSPLLTTFPSPC